MNQSRLFHEGLIHWPKIWKNHINFYIWHKFFELGNSAQCIKIILRYGSHNQDLEKTNKHFSISLLSLIYPSIFNTLRQYLFIVLFCSLNRIWRTTLTTCLKHSKYFDKQNLKKVLHFLEQSEEQVWNDFILSTSWFKRYRYMY